MMVRIWDRTLRLPNHIGGHPQKPSAAEPQSQAEPSSPLWRTLLCRSEPTARPVPSACRCPTPAWHPPPWAVPGAPERSLCPRPCAGHGEPGSEHGGRLSGCRPLRELRTCWRLRRWALLPRSSGGWVLTGLALRGKLAALVLVSPLPPPRPVDSHPSPCLHVAFLLCTQKASSGDSCKDVILSAKGPSNTTSFNLSYLSQGPVPKYSHFGGQDFNV